MLIHSWVSGPLGCFHLLAIVIRAAINMGVHISLGDPTFSYFEYIPTSGIMGLYGSCIFNFLPFSEVTHKKQAS